MKLVALFVYCRLRRVQDTVVRDYLVPAASVNAIKNSDLKTLLAILNLSLQ